MMALEGLQATAPRGPRSKGPSGCSKSSRISENMTSSAALSRMTSRFLRIPGAAAHDPMAETSGRSRRWSDQFALDSGMSSREPVDDWPMRRAEAQEFLAAGELKIVEVKAGGDCASHK